MVLSIDPGVNTGWCVWEDKIPREWGCITEPDSNKRAELPQRIKSMVLNLSETLDWVIEKLPLVIIEGTEFWESSSRSRTSARSGSLQFLSMLVGAYCQAFSIWGCNVKVISPRQWKGNMPDKLVRDRANTILAEHGGGLEKVIHTCCAIGIGANHFSYKEFHHVTESERKKKITANKKTSDKIKKARKPRIRFR